MDKITQFTKTNMVALRAEIDATLKPLQDKYGVKLTLGNLRFDNSSARSPLTMSIVTPGVDPAKADFEKYATMIGLDKSDLGKQIMIGNKQLQITGYKRGARKNCIRLTDARGKAYVGSVDTIKRALGKSTALTPFVPTLPDEPDNSLTSGVTIGEIDAVLKRVEKSNNSTTSKTGTDLLREWQELIGAVTALDEKAGAGLRVGKLLSFPYADGKAHYIIVGVNKQFVNVKHVNIGDGWHDSNIVIDGPNGRCLRSVAEANIRQSESMRSLKKATASL